MKTKDTYVYKSNEGIKVGDAVITKISKTLPTKTLSQLVKVEKERDILLAAVKKHIAKYERPRMVCHDLVDVIEKIEGRDEN